MKLGERTYDPSKLWGLCCMWRKGLRVFPEWKWQRNSTTVRIHPAPPQPRPTIPPSGLDYKSMEEFIKEEACWGTMESNRSCLRQYGPGRSDGQCSPPAPEWPLWSTPTFIWANIRFHHFNNQFLALVAAVENCIISHQDRHRGFQTAQLLCAPVKLTVHNIIHLIYFKCS